jgi:hypothetical protein
MGLVDTMPKAGVNMTEQQLFDAMLPVAFRCRHAVYQAGGMATKSGVEDVLIHRFGCDRIVPHMVMNHIEYNGLDNLRDWRGEGEPPTLAEFPEVILSGRLGSIEVIA